MLVVKEKMLIWVELSKVKVYPKEADNITRKDKQQIEKQGFFFTYVGIIVSCMDLNEPNRVELTLVESYLFKVIYKSLSSLRIC